MTDRELLQQALEALENFARFQRMMMDGPDASDRMLAEDWAETGFKQMAIAIPALRERLAREGQPEAYWLIAPNGSYYKNPKHPMNAQQGQKPAQKYDYSIKYDRGCFKCRSHFCPGNCIYEEQPARQEQEPVAWITPSGTLYRSADVDGCFDDSHTPLYTSPPARQWQGLTQEERIMCRSYDPEETVAKTEAKLKEKNA